MFNKNLEYNPGTLTIINPAELGKKKYTSNIPNICTGISVKLTLPRTRQQPRTTPPSLQTVIKKTSGNQLLHIISGAVLSSLYIFTVYIPL
jgi:hypothetical protein